MDQQQLDLNILKRDITRRRALQAGGVAGLGLAFGAPLVRNIRPAPAFAQQYGGQDPDPPQQPTLKDYMVWGEETVNLGEATFIGALVGSGGNMSSSEDANPKEGVRVCGDASFVRDFNTGTVGDLPATDLGKDVLANGNVTLNANGSDVNIRGDVCAGGTVTTGGVDIVNIGGTSTGGKTTPLFDKPTLPTVTPCVGNSDHRNGGTHNLAPGTYGEMREVTLNLTAGVYNFLQLRQEGAINIDLTQGTGGQICICVQNYVAWTTGFSMTVIGGDASNVTWFVFGDQFSIGNLPANGGGFGTVYVPNGSINLLSGSFWTWEGAFYSGTIMDLNTSDDPIDIRQEWTITYVPSTKFCDILDT